MRRFHLNDGESLLREFSRSERPFRFLTAMRPTIMRRACLEMTDRAGRILLPSFGAARAACRPGCLRRRPTGSVRQAILEAEFVKVGDRLMRFLERRALCIFNKFCTLVIQRL
jgi:hypothetical protein